MINQRRWGALLSYVNIIVSVIIGLVYTPLMLRLLGQSEYGLYSLIGSVVAYLSVLDMGLGNTIVRFTAKNRADGTVEKEAQLNGLFLMVYSVIGVVSLLAGVLLYQNIASLFGDKLTPDELERARIMMVLLVANVSFSFPFSIFAAVLQAYENFIILRVINILRVVLNPLLALPFLYWGYGAVMMVIVATVLNFSCLLSYAYYCIHKLHIKFHWGKYEGKFLKEISSYSFFVFLNVIMDKVYWGSGQFVLGIVDGTLQVAIYAVAMQFIAMYKQFSGAISGVMLPKVTMMVAKHAPVKELTALMIRVGRLQYLVVGYIFIMFALVGEAFINLWAGIGYVTAYPVVLLLMAALFIPLVQNVGIAILLAMNRNKFRMTVYTLCALASFGVSFPLAGVYGTMGCAMATASALFISTGLIMNCYYAKVINLGVGEFWRSIGRMSVGILLWGVLAYYLNFWLGMTISWIGLVKIILADTLLYVFIAYGVVMNDYERGLVNRIAKRLGVCEV